MIYNLANIKLLFPFNHSAQLNYIYPSMLIK